MSEAQDVLAVQQAAFDAAAKLSKKLDATFLRLQLSERANEGLRSVLADIREVLGLAENFPKESLPGMVSAIFACHQGAFPPEGFEVVKLSEIGDWLHNRGFLRPKDASKKALFEELECIADRAINAETDRYNLQQTLEQERKRSEDLANRLNRVGLCHNAAVVELAAASSRIAHLESANASALAECESFTKRIAELGKPNSFMREKLTK